MAPVTAVHRHRGRPLINGGFVVEKTDDEDRVISACNPLNDLLDPAKLPRPRFGLVTA